MTACNSNNSTNSSTEKDNTSNPLVAIVDTFEIIEYCDTFPIDTFDNNSPAMTINISLPILKGNSERAKRINHYIGCGTVGIDQEETEPDNTIEQKILKYVEHCKADYYSNHSQYLNEKGINHSAAWLNYSYHIEGNIIDSKKGTICCEANIITYQGGAHGIENKVYINVDSINCNPYSLTEVFSEEGYTNLSERLTAVLARQLGVTTLEEINEKGYLTDIDMWPTQNFHITDDSIYFHYCPYEIAPYALGSTTIAVGLDELKDLMK